MRIEVLLARKANELRTSAKSDFPIIIGVVSRHCRRYQI